MKIRRLLFNTVTLLAVIFTLCLLVGCVDNTEYTVTVIDADHATVTTAKSAYRSGETVDVNISVDDGYVCNLKVGNFTYFDDFEMPGYNITIEVVTRAREYSIKYEVPDECSYMSMPDSYYTVNDEVRLPVACMYGYDFQGWYTDAALNSAITLIEVGTTGNITLYPKFAPTTYSPVYHLPDDVINDPNNPTSYTIESDALPLYDIEMEGCQFLGWYSNSSFKGDALSAIPAGTSGNIDLYPKFLSTDYTDDGYRIIRNKVDLEWALVHEYDSEGKYLLKGDIVYNDGEKNPSVHGFSGVFDGGGHSIKNLSRALFDTISGATIENLSFSTVQSHTLKVETDIERKIGGLVNSTGADGGTSYIRNVRVISAKITTDLKAPLKLGAIIGYAHGKGELIIEKCLVENLDFDIFAAGSTSVGGILGSGHGTIKECAVRMDDDDLYDIECTNSYSELYVGGLVGYGYNLSISNCYFRQETLQTNGFNVYASKYCVMVGVGGLMGYADLSYISDSYALLSEINFDSNAVSLTPIQIYISGLVGYSYSVSINRSYLDSLYGEKVMLNSTVMKSGITMRLHMAYLAGYFDDGETHVSYTESRSMVKKMYSGDQQVSNAYIDDETKALTSDGPTYSDVWDKDIWAHIHGYKLELKFLVDEE